MSALAVTSRGRVTLGKGVLKHLGVRPGDRIQLDLMPDGRAELRAEVRNGSWLDLAGVLEGKTNGARLTIEELDEAVAQAGAAAGMLGA